MQRRYDGSAYIDIAHNRRWNGSAWQDCEFLRKFNGTSWIDVWPVQYFGVAQCMGDASSYTISNGVLSMALRDTRGTNISGELFLTNPTSFQTPLTITVDCDFSVSNGILRIGSFAALSGALLSGEEYGSAGRSVKTVNVSDNPNAVFLGVQAINNGSTVQAALNVYSISVNGIIIPIQ